MNAYCLPDCGCGGGAPAFRCAELPACAVCAEPCGEIARYVFCECQGGGWCSPSEHDPRCTKYRPTALAPEEPA